MLLRRLWKRCEELSTTYKVISNLVAIFSILGFTGLWLLKKIGPHDLWYTGAVFLSITFAVLWIYVSIANAKLAAQWQHLVNAIPFMHQMAHDLRDQAEKLLATAPVQMKQNDINLLLQFILNNAKHTFAQMTNHPCSASIMMPEAQNSRIRTVMYDSSVPTTRQKRSVSMNLSSGSPAYQALNASKPLIFNDYRKLRNTNAFQPRPEWEKDYLSGIITRFNVDDAPYGFLNIDSPGSNAFSDDTKELACMFADACAAVFKMEQIFVARNKKN